MIAASNCLEGHVIRTAINHLNGKKNKEEDFGLNLTEKIIMLTDSIKGEAVRTLDIIHPECILEWVEAIELQITDD